MSGEDRRFFKDDSSVELDIREERIEKLNSLREKGINPYPAKFEKEFQIKELKDKFGSLVENPRIVATAGRVMAVREHGKATFLDLHDCDDKIQIFLSKNNFPEDYKFILRVLDVGDIVGIKGVPFYTKRGEPTIEAKEFYFLSKALRPMPEKWHGLKDVEIRYRRRYVDLIVNPEVREIFRVRSRVISTIRKILSNKGFLEVETPMMQLVPGGAAARPFVTHHNALDIDLYLRIAPELYLKRLIVGGYEKVFELGKSFRNEGISTRHNPEFTMVEVYQAYADYRDMMELAEEIISETAREVFGSYVVNEINFERPWKKLSLIELFKEKIGLDISEGVDWEEVERKAEELGVEGETPKKKFDNLFGKLIEPELVQPTIVYDYPVEISPLAKRHPDNPRLVQRFEIFIRGQEIGNAYSELNDPLDQLERFKKQEEEREGWVDWDFVRALEYAMPPTGGLGIGIDRLVMVYLGIDSIREVILFPLLRPRVSTSPESSEV